MNASIVSLKKTCLIALALVGLQAAQAQLQTPAASPFARLQQKVGLTDVEVAYSRPSMKEREVFGNLVPYGEIWRTGANSATQITFSDDVTLGGQPIPAGTYALYTIPGKSEWTLIVYNSTELWGSFGYDPSKDVARIAAKPQKLKSPVETFTIGFDQLRNDSAQLYLEWERTRVPVELKVPTDEKVMAQIEELRGTSEFRSNPNALFAAGTYFHESNRDLEQALDWVTAALEQREEPAYWMFARKARIEKALGRKEAARESAQKTLELATAGNNPDYQKIARDLLESL